MNTNAETWSNSTKAIFTGVLIVAACGVLMPIFEMIIGSVRQLALFASAFSSKAINFSIGGAWNVICALLFAGAFYGWFAISKELDKFASALEPADGALIGKIRTAILLLLVAFGVRFLLTFVVIPGAIWLDNLLFCVYFLGLIGGYCLIMLSFMGLKQSPTFPAQSGANLMFLAMICLMIGPALRLLNMAVSTQGIAGIFNLIGTIAGSIVLILAWNKIKDTVVKA